MAYRVIYFSVYGIYVYGPYRALILFFFYLGFTARQDHFTHFEPSQSVGGVKTGDPREKPPDHLQAELGLSHISCSNVAPTDFGACSDGRIRLFFLLSSHM